MKFSRIVSFIILIGVGIFLVTPALAATLGNCPNPNGTELCNPTGAGSLDLFIQNILTAVGVILGVLTIAMLVYSGFRMIVAAGNEESISKARTSLQWTVIGFVVTVFAFVIVAVIGNVFDNQPINPDSVTPQSPIGYLDYRTLADALLTSALTVVGLLAIVFIIIGGFRYVTARGNEEQAATAKRTLTWAIAGLVISILAYVIVVALAKLTNS